MERSAAALALKESTLKPTARARDFNFMETPLDRVCEDVNENRSRAVLPRGRMVKFGNILKWFFVASYV